MLRQFDETEAEAEAEACGRSAHTCVAVPAGLMDDEGTTLLVHAGWDGHPVRDDVWVYGTHRRRWSRLQTEGCTPPPRALHAACLLGDEFVVTGGWNGGEAQHADVWALTLTPDACRWAPLTVDAEVA